MARRQLLQLGAIDGVGPSDRRAAGRHSPERGRAATAFEDGPLADDGARSEFDQQLAVHFHGQHPVEKQVQLVTGIALVDERLARLDPADPGLGAVAHDRAGEGPLDLVPYSLDSRKALELTFREALRLGHNYIGTEHILLALIEIEPGAGVFTSMGIDKDVIERHIVVALDNARRS